MNHRFIVGLVVGVVMALPLTVLGTGNGDPGGLALCCKDANPSCFCGSYSCCEANCQKQKDKGGVECLAVQCADRCGAKYPPQ